MLFSAGGRRGTRVCVPTICRSPECLCTKQTTFLEYVVGFQDVQSPVGSKTQKSSPKCSVTYLYFLSCPQAST